MADHGTVEIGTAEGVEFADHMYTYEGFLRLLRYVCTGIVILLILMAYFLL